MPPAPKFKRLSPDDRAQALVQAGLGVLARGGITAFTIDNICKAAGISRGLIGHHFGGKTGLLVACYAAAYAPLLQMINAGTAAQPLPALIDELLSDRQFRQDALNIWLALWGEIAVNPDLHSEHLRHYQRYETAVAASIAQHAQAHGRSADAPALAAALIALLDGLWLKMCIAPAHMTPAMARRSITALLEPHVGPLDAPAGPHPPTVPD